MSETEDHLDKAEQTINFNADTILKSESEETISALTRNVKIAEETALEYKLKVEALEYEVTKLKAKYSKKAS